MTEPERLLIIDDEENMRHMLSALLGQEGYRIDTAADGVEGLSSIKKNIYDYILCDVKMPNMDGLAFLKKAAARLDHSTVIMMSAYGSIDTALLALKAGAYDFITKPFKPDEVLLALKKAREREQLRRENQMLREQVGRIDRQAGFGNLVTGSDAMKSLIMLAEKVAHYATSVLITGESGTGKELVARGIHDKSSRAGRPFVGVNCGGVPENLLESEFFGYMKGSFTGADRDKKGLFAEADGGTLFLDEIGELPMSLQVKLLRVLQESEIRPIGAGRTQKIDVRMIAATARNLEEEIQHGLFRDDLYFRLNVVHLDIPPLRRRKDDIPLLANYFLKKLSRKMHHSINNISPAAMSLLMQHNWPGNVRELENVMEHAIILANKNIILPENLPEHIGGRSGTRRLDDYFGGFSLKSAQKIMEKGLIGRALEATHGNKSSAARLLEISYPSLLHKIKEYGINSKAEG
ncbi:MAG: sigma-54 dependent transcriptional regulator [Desulfobulbaceae bacterium]|nr:sigma-54 dependent transcriptional regulator [Desulfobulbaceae bacterium]